MRFVECGGQALADLERTKPGRGAYVHISESCLLAGGTEQLLLRSLRRFTSRASSRRAKQSAAGDFVKRIEAEVSKSRKEVKQLAELLKQQERMSAKQRNALRGGKLRL